MGVFKFAASLCEDLSRMIRIFGWGDEHSQQKRPLDWLGQKNDDGRGSLLHGILQFEALGSGTGCLSTLEVSVYAGQP
jgi:hypothetical protein